MQPGSTVAAFRGRHASNLNIHNGLTRPARAASLRLESMSLKRQIAKGSLWVLLGGGGQQLIGFVVFIYIARVLNPAVVGIVAFAVIAIDLAGFISRWGQIEVITREVAPSPKLLATSFWISATIGAGAMAVLLIASLVMRVNSDNATLAHVLMLLAPVPLLQGLSVVPEALFRRRMDFRSLALRNWIATVAGGVAAISIAQYSPGVDVLVGQRLTTAIVQIFTLWSMIRWLPSFDFILKEAPRLLRDGLQILVSSLSNMLNERVGDGLTGAFLGPAQLGFLRLGWRFSDAIVQVSVMPVSLVTLSSFSQMQGDLPAIGRAYTRMTQIMALLSLPIFFGLGAIAEPLISTVFGSKWMGVVPALQLLGVIMLGSSVNYFFNSAMIAVGRSDILMRHSIAQLGIMVAYMLIGVQFGLVGVMIAHCFRSFSVSALNMTALKSEIGIRATILVGALIPPVISCALMWLAVTGCNHLIDAKMPSLVSLPYVKMGLLVAGGATVYAASLLAGDVIGLWRGYTRDVISSLSGLRSQPSSVIPN